MRHRGIRIQRFRIRTALYIRAPVRPHTETKTASRKYMPSKRDFAYYDAAPAISATVHTVSCGSEPARYKSRTARLWKPEGATIYACQKGIKFRQPEITEISLRRYRDPENRSRCGGIFYLIHLHRVHPLLPEHPTVHGSCLTFRKRKYG